MMLLGDFDDLDKYLVDARDLFRNLKAVRELSADLSYLTEEQIALIRRFWEHFPSDGKGHAAAFLGLWERLHDIYETFRMNLKEKGLAYEGMLYREVAEQFRAGEEPDVESVMVYFTGFNALTPAEEILFKGMQRMEKARFFWDYDVAYLEGHGGQPLAGHDAGRFISKYLKIFPPPVELGIFENLTAGEKKIGIWSSPNRTTQSWVVQKVLEEWGAQEVFERERVAVVLSDEQLLLPVLHAMPAGAGEINVTMGYPLRASPVYAFFREALRLVKNRRAAKEGSFLYYYADVISLLHNPLVGAPDRETIGRWEKEIIAKNRVFLYAGEIPAGDLPEAFFENTGEPVVWSRTLLEVLYRLVVSSLPGEESNAVNLNLEVFYRLTLLVTRFNDFVTAGHIRLTPEGYLTLLLHLAEKESVSFYGEPLAGMQVMGILETRLLDFDRLIILSVNEGNLPAPASSASYIPYNLRKGFGLPAWEHRDSLYAYYFFRLIQRAKEVVLVYHTETEDGMTGEKSRFISQIQYFTGLKTEMKNLFYRPGITGRGTVSVEKDDAILEKMRTLYAGSKYLSPSVLNTYLNCRLSFYYRYVAGVREPDEMSEEVDNALFGQLIHKALEILYTPGSDAVPPDGRITADLLEEMKKKYVARAVDRALQEVLFGGIEEKNRVLSPLHTIVRTMVINYVGKVLEYDRQLAPLTTLGVEKTVCDRLTVTAGEQQIAVNLCGKIDRIDRVEGQVRVVDYKTGGGGAGKLRFGTVAELFDREKNNRKKEVFQILMYAMMYAKEAPPRPVLYFLKDMFGSPERQQIKAGAGRKKEIFHFGTAEMQEFREQLTALLEEIFDPAVPFDMTAREEHCRYCPYKSICEKE
jgi:CRISPR/Cas system-associated exonuclease Cas4 (RecB family)